MSRFIEGGAMKKLISLILIVLGSGALLVTPNLSLAASESGTLTGAARTTFSAPASLNGISLTGADIGTGVFVEADGSASGTFNAVLNGGSLLGNAQKVVVEGRVLEGAIAPDGRVQISGLATVAFGDGVASLQGIPFTVSATTNSVLLSVGSTVLPTAGLTEGVISIE